MTNKKILFFFILGLTFHFLFLSLGFVFAEEINVNKVSELKHDKDGKFAQKNQPYVDSEPVQVEETGKEKIINSYDYCTNSYQQNQDCPKDICALQCIKQIGSRVCVLECLPKQCLDISPEKCPQDICKVFVGCNNKNICYPRDTREPPKCGSLAYAGDDVKCCEGYVKRCGIEFFDGSCDMEGSGSLDSVPICIPCGNGICNQFENRCNCPEDCSNDENMIELLKSIKAKIDSKH